MNPTGKTIHFHQPSPNFIILIASQAPTTIKNEIKERYKYSCFTSIFRKSFKQTEPKWVVHRKTTKP